MKKRKNVIMLTIDALRADHTTPYGYNRDTTPFLNTLAQSGILFEHAYATGPYTQASFPGILTSTHYLDIDDRKKLSKQRTLISEALKKHGITTAAFHSNPYLSGFFGYNRGWDLFYDSMDAELPDDCPYETAASINAKAQDWLAEWASENAERAEPQPFFLWMHYMDVHEPYMPSQENLAKINPKLDITRDAMTTLFKHTLLPRKTDNADDVATLRDLYDAQILDADDALREFFTQLETMHLLEDTTIIITADHGDEFNDHGGLSHDAKLYNELVRTPLIIINSDESAQKFAGVASTLDVAPTVLSLFGIEPPTNWQGTNLLPLASYSRSHALSEAIDKTTHERVHSIQDTTHKIILHPSNGAVESYSLADDPGEHAQDVQHTQPALRTVLDEYASRQSKPHESAQDTLLSAAEDIDL